RLPFPDPRPLRGPLWPSRRPEHFESHWKGTRMRRDRTRKLALGIAVLAMACSGEPTSAVRTFGDGLGGGTLAFSILSPTSTFPGDRVKVLGGANIRAAASVTGTLVGAQPNGAAGTVVGGPVVDTKGDGLTRWQIDFDSGPDGW